jgi:topoisomerase-4 subunit A
MASAAGWARHGCAAAVVRRPRCGEDRACARPACRSTSFSIAKTSGYGFVCTFGDLLSRQKAGKTFLAVEEGASILPPVRLAGKDHLAALSEDGRLLIFPIEQMKRLSSGKGVQLIGLREAESLRAVIASHGPRVTIKGVVRNRIKTLVSEAHHVAVRARRGSPVGQLSNVTLAAYPE